MEQEIELGQMLNMRFGYGTMEELKEMRRSIKKKREATVYAQMERQKKLMDGIAIVLISGLAIGIFGFVIYIIGVGQGRW